MISKEILEDLIKDSPCVKEGICDDKEGHWCMLRDLIPYISIDGRMAEQLILIYDYKFMESKRVDYDIGKERAFSEFIEKYGKKFSEIYQEGMTNGELFKAVYGFEKEHNDEDVRNHLMNN